jgi:hypothetical protein
MPQVLSDKAVEQLGRTVRRVAQMANISSPSGHAAASHGDARLAQIVAVLPTGSEQTGTEDATAVDVTVYRVRFAHLAAPTPLGHRKATITYSSSEVYRARTLGRSDHAVGDVVIVLRAGGELWIIGAVGSGDGTCDDCSPLRCLQPVDTPDGPSCPSVIYKYAIDAGCLDCCDGLAGGVHTLTPAETDGVFASATFAAVLPLGEAAQEVEIEWTATSITWAALPPHNGSDSTWYDEGYWPTVCPTAIGQTTDVSTGTGVIQYEAAWAGFSPPDGDPCLVWTRDPDLYGDYTCDPPDYAPTLPGETAVTTCTGGGDSSLCGKPRGYTLSTVARWQLTVNGDDSRLELRVRTDEYTDTWATALTYSPAAGFRAACKSQFRLFSTPCQCAVLDCTASPESICVGPADLFGLTRRIDFLQGCDEPTSNVSVEVSEWYYGALPGLDETYWGWTPHNIHLPGDPGLGGAGLAPEGLWPCLSRIGCGLMWDEWPSDGYPGGSRPQALLWKCHCDIGVFVTVPSYLGGEAPSWIDGQGPWWSSDEPRFVGVYAVTFAPDRIKFTLVGDTPPTVNGVTWPTSFELTAVTE